MPPLSTFTQNEPQVGSNPRYVVAQSTHKKKKKKYIFDSLGALIL